MTARSVASVALAVLLASTAAFADDDPHSAAREHFARGVELVDEGAFEQAAHEFQRAYDLEPNAAVLYNMGQAFAAAGRPVEAVSALARYLEAGGAAIPSTRR